MGDRKRVLYLFDVDGTLTEPRQAIAAETWRFLAQEAAARGHVGVVSGSDWAKVAEQLGGAAAAHTLAHVFCENGLVAFGGGELRAERSMLDELGEQLVQRVINAALAHLARVTLPAKRGTFVEFRTGMLNVCPVGRSCSAAERAAFVVHDQRHGVRAALADALRAEFAGCGLTVALGGQISVDVFPTGWDKTYCLRMLAAERYDEIHFFGDKTEPGGNDYEIFMDSRTIGHTVTSPSDTIQQLKKMFNID